MKKIIIVAESGSDVNEELAKQYDVTIVPMHVQFGEETLDDGSFPVEKIVKYYRDTNKLPKTKEEYLQISQTRKSNDSWCAGQYPHKSHRNPLYSIYLSLFFITFRELIIAITIWAHSIAPQIVKVVYKNDLGVINSR